jgi:arylsulfatase A-like enzyme
LGALFDGLSDLGLLDGTVIVLTSDHGEYLGEHHLVEHSKDIYQQAQWVPLIVRAPGQKRRERIDTIASSTDVPHLILSEFPDPLRAELLPLFPNAPGNHVVISENYYTRSNDLYDERWGHRFDRVRTAIYEWPHKYIRSSDGRHELYALDTDPREVVNLYTADDPLARRLSAELAAFQTERLENIERSSETPAELDEALRKQLRSLGYLN